MALSNEDLVNIMERLSSSQIEATTTFTHQLTLVFAEISGVHADTTKILDYFTNGFKTAIIEALEHRYDKVDSRLNQILIVVSGALVTLLAILAKVFLG